MLQDFQDLRVDMVNVEDELVGSKNPVGLDPFDQISRDIFFIKQWFHADTKSLGLGKIVFEVLMQVWSTDRNH